jgi:hypothetical protein
VRKSQSTGVLNDDACSCMEMYVLNSGTVEPTSCLLRQKIFKKYL